MPDLTIQSSTVSTAGGPALFIHGGAWDIPDEALVDHRNGLRAAIERGRELLLSGGAAAEVAAETVAVLEGHGAFDAGCGAMLNREGFVELDAGIMDGPTLDYGAVIGVQRLKHPIRVAHRLMEVSDGQARILSRHGAERFAKVQGFDLVDNDELICERERERYRELRAEAAFHTSHSFLSHDVSESHDTVGCVVRDAGGQLAAATSTGGTPFAPMGRVGDSPLPGAGFYANEHAAASATGWGEAIAAVLLSGRSVDAVGAGTEPEAAARQQLQRMSARVANQEGKGATGGLILMSATGEATWAFTTPRMARGGWRESGSIWVDV